MDEQLPYFLKTQSNNTNLQSIKGEIMKILKNLLILIIFMSFFVVAQDLASAKIRINENNFDEAETFLLKALNHPKDKWEAAFHLADKVYPNKEKWNLVRQNMDIALTAPKNFKIRPTRNSRKILMTEAVAESLLDSYNKIYLKASNYLVLINQTSSAEERSSLIEEAMEVCLAGIELNPSQPGGYALMSIFASVKGDKETTQKYLNLGLAIPDLPDETIIAVLTSGGQSFIRLAEYEDALNLFNKALDVDEKNVSVLESLGSLYLAQDNFELALQYLTQAIELTEDEKKMVDLFFNRGLVYLKMEKFDEAEYNFEEAYFLAPDDLEALFGLAKALEEAERWRKARNYYLELIDQSPENPQYYYGVYRTYFEEGRLEDAQQYLNQANALNK